MTTMDTHSAFDFYQSITHRLPPCKPDQASGGAPRQAADLLSIADHYDAFVFDAFGVLNVGVEVIPGAIECIEQLRTQNKRVIVLTNGASSALSTLVQKYEKFGFKFSDHEIVSSRHAAERALVSDAAPWSAQSVWGAITGGVSTISDLQVKAVELTDDKNAYDQVDAFVFLSSADWNEHRQQLLTHSLLENPRPLVIANPDVVAPLPAGYSLEPGYFAHIILDRFDKEGMRLTFQFHGKPFPSVYNIVRERIGEVPEHRVAMLGDTLHTDVLGAKAQGWGSVLVADHGLFRGHELTPFIAATGLTPDWIIPSI